MCLGLFFQKWKIGYHIIKTKYASWYFFIPNFFLCVFQSLSVTSLFFAPLLSLFLSVFSLLLCGQTDPRWDFYWSLTLLRPGLVTTICLPVIPYPNLPYPEILECNFFLSFSGFFLNTLFNSLILILCEEIIRIVVF